MPFYNSYVLYFEEMKINSVDCDYAKVMLPNKIEMLVMKSIIS